MHLIDPEVLDLTRQLSPAINVLALVVGLLLWLMGAYGHRFWLAITVTAGAGVAGLYVGPGYGVQPLVAALLLALSAGVVGGGVRGAAVVAGGGRFGRGAARLVCLTEPVRRHGLAGGGQLVVAQR